MTLQELLPHFGGGRKIGPSSYQCKCPAHLDNKASLTVSEKDGKILLHCHAGCDTRDILEAVGLSFKDLGEPKRSSWRERLEKSRGKRIEAVYDYQDENGRYLYSKVRFEGKDIRYITVDRANDQYSYCKMAGRATLYNLPTLLKALKAGSDVYIVEGEKDVETLKKLGLTATTAGGVQDWRREYARYFTGAKVTILPDNDKPGLKLKDEIVRDLKYFAHSIRWAVTAQEEKGDVTDYLTKEGHIKEDLLNLIKAQENRGAPWLYVDERERVKINADLLADGISRGLPYLIVRRPEEDKDDFYIYEGGVYRKCNRNKVKSLIRRYVPVGLASDNLINNVYNLLLCQERNICSFRDMDTDETYINLKNGLYNLKTGSLDPHTPKLYSTLQLNCEYHPENSYRPVFDRYMSDLCSDRDGHVDREKMAVIQEYGGMILSNVKVYRTKLCLVLWSLLGNSGKTQLLNLIGELLGTDRVANIPIQNMNEASKFALGNILGKRLISVGDQTGSEIRDSAIFKQLTGGDAVQVEQKNKQPYSYIFPGGIIIACNNLPGFQDDKGGHIFERLCIVPCINTIEQDRRDGELLDKMLKERDAIFNWFLEGLHRLIKNHYKVTKAAECEKAIGEYREKLDTVYRFLTEYYIVTGDRNDMVSKPEFDKKYTDWCLLNETRPVSRQNIKDRMEANGCPVDKANLDGKRGVTVYRGLKEKEFQGVTDEEYSQQSFPFP